MMALKYLATVLLAACAIAAPFNEEIKAVNDRPVIGILAMEVEPTPLAEHFGNYTSHIVASYVKWMEGAGARVVPIMIYQDLEYYLNIIKQVNGIVIPGGPTLDDEGERRVLRAARDVTKDGISPLRASKRASNPIEGSGYGEGGAILMYLAKRLNDAGDYLPVWGTCLGFQLVSMLGGVLAGSAVDDYRVRCAADNLIAPTDFTEDFKTSNLFKDASPSIIQILQKEPVTAHYHGYCFTEEVWSSQNFSQVWNILSTNNDFNNMKFVSTIEAKDYPFYGAQYHPEKLGFEWNTYEQSPHNSHAISVMQYFGNFFVNEARKNTHKFPSLAEERASLIYNYPATYTGDKSVYEQVYFF